MARVNPIIHEMAKTQEGTSLQLSVRKYTKLSNLNAGFKLLNILINEET